MIVQGSASSRVAQLTRAWGQIPLANRTLSLVGHCEPGAYALDVYGSGFERTVAMSSFNPASELL
jgi:hypothetical protein